VSKKKKLVVNNGCGLGFYLGLILMLTIVYSFISRIVSGERISRQLSSSQTSLAVAIINREKEFFGNSPVSRQYYYRYYFKINGTTYLGDSRDPSKKPGDTILVRYYIPDPNANAPVIK
jgi:hypothetical protein